MRTKTKKLSLVETLAALESGEVLDLGGQSVKMPVVLTAEMLAMVAGGMKPEPTTHSGDSCGADDCGCW